MEAMRFVTVGLLLLLTVGSAPSVWGQDTPLEGAMIAPVMRSAMWAYLGNAAYASQLWQAVNNDYFTRLNCGGKRTTDADFEQKCSPCGDAANSNRPNEYGGKYSIGKVVAQYHEGHHINVSVDIRSSYQGGIFRFSLCVTDKTTKVSHACFRQHVLRWQNTKITQIPAPRQLGLATYTLQLPAGVTCQNCVIQWLWRDARSTCDPSGSSNCGQQTVTNCADVQILSAGVPFPTGFDKPRYDAYSSIFDPMDTPGKNIDDHGVGIHVPRSSLDPPLTIKPANPPPVPSPGGSVPMTIPGGVPSTNPSPGGSVPVVKPGGVPSKNPSPGGSIPVLIPGGVPATNPSPGSSVPVITVIPGGVPSTNKSTGGDDEDPPETSEKLLDPVTVVLPALVGTTSVLAGRTGIGLALLVLALYMYMSQQQSLLGGALFGSPAPPMFLSSPWMGQSYFNPTTSFQQTVVPSASVYNSGALSYTQPMNGRVIQGLSGVSGVPYPYSQNSYVASGLLNPEIAPFTQTGVASSSTASVFQQPFVNMNSVSLPATAAVGIPQSVIHGNINHGFTQFQAPFISGSVPVDLSSNTAFSQQTFGSNGFVPTTSNIPFPNNGFSVTSQQFPQRNNAFVRIPNQQSFINGNPQTLGTFQAPTSFQTPFQNRPDVVMPQFDQEPSTTRQRETDHKQEETEDVDICECHSHIHLLTAHCFELSASECQEDDVCFCKQETRQVPGQFSRGQPPLSANNLNQAQKMMSPAQGTRFQRRLPSMQ